MPTLPLVCHYAGVYFETLCSKPPVKKFRFLKKVENQLDHDNETGRVEETNTENFEKGENMKSKLDRSCFESGNKTSEEGLHQKLYPMKDDSVVRHSKIRAELDDSDTTKKLLTFTTKGIQSDSKRNGHEEGSELISDSEDLLQGITQKKEISPEVSILYFSPLFCYQYINKQEL